MNNPEYKMFRVHNKWRVQRVTYSDNGFSTTTGAPLFEHHDQEEARKELYRLNGWKYSSKQ